MYIDKSSIFRKQFCSVFTEKPDGDLPTFNPRTEKGMHSKFPSLQLTQMARRLNYGIALPQNAASSIVRGCYRPKSILLSHESTSNRGEIVKHHCETGWAGGSEGKSLEKITYTFSEKKIKKKSVKNKQEKSKNQEKIKKNQKTSCLN